MQLLDHIQVLQKTKRLAIQIIENNYKEEELIFLGINSNGKVFSELLAKWIPKDYQGKISLSRVKLNPANPTEQVILLDHEAAYFHGKAIILIDDVANTGRTLFYAMKPLFEVIPKKLEIAVLVDRKHKAFPVHVDYVGTSLATTLQENIQVNIQNEGLMEVFLR